MVSPGYSYRKAPDQQNFLRRRQTQRLFGQLLEHAPRRWRFCQTPLFLEFLRGGWELDCTPWGSPTYNVFGWQRPCYLLDEGYCESFAELMETTDWGTYGHRSGNPKCADCMVHCGHEPSALAATFGSLQGFLRTVRLSLLGFGPSPDFTDPQSDPCEVESAPGKLPILQSNPVDANTSPTPSTKRVGATNPVRN